MQPLRPDDSFNKILADNVHPADWSNPTAAARYNLVVVGGGTAGLVTASAAAQMGERVALVERESLGGDCLNVGCVPSKAIIAASRVAAQARHSGEFGVSTGDVSVDFATVMQRMRRLRASISHHDSAQRFASLGVDVFFGDATFVNDSTLRVGDADLKFRKAVIATGARAAAPPIPGLDSVDYLTNENLFSLTELPGRLGIIGAGPIGCEMAQAFARLGSQVVLIESGTRILGREDSDGAAIVHQTLIDDGVRIVCGSKDLKIQPVGGRIELKGIADGLDYREQVDRLLVAVGRAPNVDGLGLENIGVQYENRRGVVVDDRLRTTNRRIFAAGDVCSRYQFTHAADFMARIVLRNALFPFGRQRLSRLVVPWCTYTSPELAQVGLSAQSANDEGIAIDSYDVPMDQVDRAILDGQSDGFVRIHVRRGSDSIVGATIVADHAGDMISQIAMAMTNGTGLANIAGTIFPYPTQAEAIRRAGDQFNRTRLTPRVRWLFARWLKFRR